MERINHRQLVQTILERHSLYHSNQNTEVQLIFDLQRDHYLLFRLGWENEGMRRVYGCTIHIDIKKNKIWIQRDLTEMGVANELLEAGVPKQDIVLGFQAPYKRKYTDFAIE